MREGRYTQIYARCGCDCQRTGGIDYVQKNMPRKTTTVWAAAVDEELTSRCYIVPGIGDAGDLAYGEKV